MARPSSPVVVRQAMSGRFRKAPRLTLGRSDDPPGPLERNVVKNLLAARLSDTLKQAGRDLMEGGDERAVASVREFLDLLDGLRRDVPGFQNDAARTP